MRYGPEHKARTRERILREAGRLFRRHGYRGVGIDRIMAAARLTRGGFYAHFASKAELFAAVVERGTDFVRRLGEARSGGLPANVEAACAVVSGYLDPANREKIARGCTLATLTQDVPRTGPAAKAAYARQVRDLAAEIEAHLPADLPPDVRRERALAVVILCVGGIGVGRSVGDEELAREALRTARDRACAVLRASG
jgi:TetR/AcrR family transcriptional repressor of nem operon